MLPSSGVAWTADRIRLCETEPSVSESEEGEPHSFRGGPGTVPARGLQRSEIDSVIQDYVCSKIWLEYDA